MKSTLMLVGESILFGLILWGAIFGALYATYPPY